MKTGSKRGGREAENCSSAIHSCRATRRYALFRFNYVVGFH